MFFSFPLLFLMYSFGLGTPATVFCVEYRKGTNQSSKFTMKYEIVFKQ